MAKKDQDLKYLQMPLPQGQNATKMTKVNWSGLNKRQVMDTGELSAAMNISTDEAPYLVPSQKRLPVLPKGASNPFEYDNPISMFGFNDFLVIVYKAANGDIKIAYIDSERNEYISTLQAYGSTGYTDEQRCIVKFNHYTNPDNVIDNGYVEKLLIFPDKKSMNTDIAADDFELASILNMPNIKYATVHLSRLFGVDKSRVYASGFNNYANWNTDTLAEDGYSPNNAWFSATGSNTKASGDFTGIAAFSNHVICFKSNFMHEIYNNKNPFRVQDIYAEGTIDQRSIQDVDGNLIFVDKDYVKIYTGGNPRIISHNLGVKSFLKAVSGTDGRKYYLYCQAEDGHHLFVYDTMYGQWAEEEITCGVISFAHNSNGMYMLTSDGNILKIDTGIYADHDWYAETDLIMGNTIDIKHLKKIQMLADMDNNSELSVEVLYGDETGESNTVFSHSNTAGESVRIPIRVFPRKKLNAIKTANYGFKIRISGTGYVKLYQMELFLTKGGELYG